MRRMDRPNEFWDENPYDNDPDLLYRRNEEVDDYTRLMEVELLREQFAADRMMDLNSRHERGEVSDLEYGLEEDLIRVEIDAQARARIEEVEGAPVLEDLGVAENPDGPWRHQAAVDELIREKSPEGVEQWAIELYSQGRIRQEDLERIQEQTHEARHGQDGEPDPAE